MKTVVSSGDGRDQASTSVKIEREQLNPSLTPNGNLLPQSLPLPFIVKLGYVTTSFGLETAASIWGLFAVYYMTDVALLSASLVSWVSMLYRFWDAANDPIIAILCDNTSVKSKMGRRRGWMFYVSSQFAMFCYYLCVQCGSDLFFTSVNVAHLSLLSDMTVDYKERFRVNSLRFVASICAYLVSFGLVGIFAATIPNEHSRFKTLGLIMAIILLACVEFSVWSTRNHFRNGLNGAVSQVNKTSHGFGAVLNAIKNVLSVKEYRWSLGTFLCSAVCMQTSLVMVPYLMQSWLGVQMKELVKMIFVALLMALFSAGGIMWLIKFVEKKTMYMFGVLMWLLFPGVLLFMHRGMNGLYPLLFMSCAFLGVGMATSFVVPFSMITDAAEFVRLKTGKHQEALVFGVTHACQKCLLGCTVFVFMRALSFSGYKGNYSNENPPPQIVCDTIKYSAFAIATTLMLIGLFCNFKNPLTKQGTLQAQQMAEDADKNKLTSTSEPPFLTVFLLDGAAAELFNRELTSGSIPVMQRMVSKGVYIRNGVTSFPSMTGYAFSPLITGQDAAESGILGLRWFNRKLNEGCFRTYVGATNSNMEIDLSQHLKTLYERFPQNHTYSSMTYMARGASIHDKLGYGVTTAKYIVGNIQPFKLMRAISKKLCPTWDEFEETVIDRAIEDLHETPKIQFIVMPSPDGIHHIEGGALKYRSVLRHIDNLIGKYQEASIRLGQEQNRIYLIAADHGMDDVNENIDLTSQLQSSFLMSTFRGTPSTTLFSSNLSQHSMIDYDSFDLIDMINGNNMSYLYVKHPTLGWSHECDFALLSSYPTHSGKVINLPQQLVQIRGVEFAITRGNQSESPFSVRVLSKTGECELVSNDKGESVCHRVLQGADPLNIPERLSGRFVQASEWLSETFKSDYPYSPIRIWRLMCNQSATPGDLIVTAEKGFDFGKDYEVLVGNYKGGHGGIRNDQMNVPFVLCGPKIREGVVLDTATNEDIGATLADLLVGFHDANSHQDPLFVHSFGHSIQQAINL